MPTTLDPFIATEWVYAALRADATLSDPTTGLVRGRVYMEQGPATATYPLVVIQSLSNVPLVGLGAALVQLGSVVMVKAVDKGTTYAALRAIGNRIETVLNGASGTTTTGQVFSCVLDGVDLLPEFTNNLDWRNVIIRVRVASQ